MRESKVNIRGKYARRLRGKYARTPRFTFVSEPSFVVILTSKMKHLSKLEGMNFFKNYGYLQEDSAASTNRWL